jgi:hypothetical protein
MKLDLHRSLSFWSGILVMAFICWAAWDSTRYCSQGNIGRVIISSQGRAVSVTQMPPKAPFRSYWGQIPFADLTNNLEVPAFPRPMSLRGRGTPGSQSEIDARRKSYGPLDYWKWKRFIVELNPATHWFLVIPHWLLLLTVALPWTALLLWRARRRKRAALLYP